MVVRLRRWVSPFERKTAVRRGATVEGETLTGPRSILRRVLGGIARIIDLERAGAVVVEAPGASDRPEWVPEDGVTALTHFIQFGDFGDGPAARAWTAADGIVDVTTLVGADANVENWWGDPTSYDPGIGLTADGYTTGAPGAEALSIIGSARTLMNNAGTMRLQWKQVDDGQSSNQIILVSADGNDQIEIQIYVADRAFEVSANGDLSIYVENTFNVGEGAINAFAFTVTSNRFDAAASGHDAATSALDENDRPPGNPLVAWIISQSSDALQSIAIYDPLPSTTGLSALSETGVTNTAPTNLRVTTWHPVGYASASDETSITISVTDYMAAENPGGWAMTFLYQSSSLSTNHFGFDDAEGNPLVGISLVSASDARIRLADVNTGEPVVGSSSDCYVEMTQYPDPLVVTPGAYTFILRATDPGGLYVEQEFTITVTA